VKKSSFDDSQERFAAEEILTKKLNSPLELPQRCIFSALKLHLWGDPF